jgi:hypothetical protein
MSYASFNGRLVGLESGSFSTESIEIPRKKASFTLQRPCAFGASSWIYFVSH